VKIHPGLARHPPFQTDDIDILCEFSPVFKRHGQVFYVSGSHLLHSLSATTQTGLQRLPLLTYVALVTLFTVIATYIPAS
jgi:hypothetical protein